MTTLYNFGAQFSKGISVAMCTYNGARFLKEQLASIGSQSMLPAELVICDDGSTDETLAVLEDFAGRAPFRVRLIRNPQNLGYAKNFEQAIRLCEYEFIALCDQDDIWYANKLAVLSSLLANDHALGGVFSDGDLIGPDGAPRARSLWQTFHFKYRERRRFASGRATELLLRENKVTGMTMMFRASLREVLLPIPATWIHDGWLAWMLCLHSTLAACPERLVAYRLHGSQQVGAPQGAIEKFAWVRRNGLSAYFDRARKRSITSYRESAEQFGVLASVSKHKLPI